MMRGPIYKVRQPAPVLGAAERLAASGVSTAHGAPVRHQAQVREILCTPDLRQQLRFQGRFRYEGAGAFDPSLFEPDMREQVREWLVEHLSVFTVEEPFDYITGRLLAAFRQAHAELGERIALQRGESVVYGARVSVDGASIRISDVTINGTSWTPAPEVPVSVSLDPELEGWWQALMSSFTSFWGDGVEEFQVLFSRGPGRALQFRSWQRFNALDLLEMMIQSGGRFPPPVAP